MRRIMKNTRVIVGLETYKGQKVWKDPRPFRVSIDINWRDNKETFVPVYFYLFILFSLRVPVSYTSSSLRFSSRPDIPS